MILSLLPVKDQYLSIFSDKFFSPVCCVWNIFEISSSPDRDAFRYMISRKLSDSAFNILRESNTSWQKPRRLFFHTLIDVSDRHYCFSSYISTYPRDSWLSLVPAYVGPSTKSILHVNSDSYMLWTKTVIGCVFITEYNWISFLDRHSLRIAVACSIITRSQRLIK
jgi:hypothetical protein